MLRTQVLTNEHKAVIECVRRKDLKYPDRVVKTGDGKYEHTNTRGKTKKFFTFRTMKAYSASELYCSPSYRLHRVNGFYIVEEL